MRRRALLMGQSKSEVAYIPFLNTMECDVLLSTRTGKASVDWNDGGTAQELIHTKMYDYAEMPTSPPAGVYTTKNYSSIFTGNVELHLNKGLKDVFSIGIYKRTRGNTNLDEVSGKFNIIDVAEFLSQFPKLYSVVLSLYGYGVTAKRARVYGDLATIPVWIQKVKIQNCDVIGFPDTLYLDIDRFPIDSDLTYFHQLNATAAGGSINKLKVIGDLSNLPSPMRFFRLEAPHPTLATFTYTAGRVWRADYDTLYINKVLTDTENDNILIDLADSVTTAIGDKVIYLRGARTSASDSAVSYLGGLGFTVTVTP